MKPPTIAPAYLALYPGLSEIARGCGYALAIHGSVITDLDLVAIPWTIDSADAGELLQRIDKYLRMLFTEVAISHATEKPHGRLAWNFNMEHGCQIDLSVMPRISVNAKLA